MVISGERLGFGEYLFGKMGWSGNERMSSFSKWEVEKEEISLAWGAAQGLWIFPLGSISTNSAPLLWIQSSIVSSLNLRSGSTWYWESSYFGDPTGSGRWRGLLMMLFIQRPLVDNFQIYTFYKPWEYDSSCFQNLF